MVPVLGDLECQYEDDGELLNADLGGIPFVDVDNVSGLDSAPYRTNKKDTEGRDGAVVEAEFETSRVIVVSGTVYGITPEQMEPYLDRLKANFAPSKEYKPFYFKAPGVALRRSMAKCTSGFRSNWDPMRRLAMAKFSVTFEAGDPIIYGTDEYLWSGDIITEDFPGFAFPFAFPFDFGAVESAIVGGISASHYGNRPAPFIATFTGISVTNPGLRHEVLNRQVSMNLSLDVGDVLTVDFHKQKVWLNGSPRRGSVTREGWFLLQPNGPNPLRLLAGSGSLSATLSTYNAWR